MQIYNQGTPREDRPHIGTILEEGDTNKRASLDLGALAEITRKLPASLVKPKAGGPDEELMPDVGAKPMPEVPTRAGGAAVVQSVHFNLDDLWDAVAELTTADADAETM